MLLADKIRLRVTDQERTPAFYLYAENSQETLQLYRDAQSLGACREIRFHHVPATWDSEAALGVPKGPAEAQSSFPAYLVPT